MLGSSQIVCEIGNILFLTSLLMDNDYQGYLHVLFCHLERGGGRSFARTPRAPAEGSRPLHSCLWPIFQSP